MKKEIYFHFENKIVKSWPVSHFNKLNYPVTHKNFLNLKLKVLLI